MQLEVGADRGRGHYCNYEKTIYRRFYYNLSTLPTSIFHAIY